MVRLVRPALRTCLVGAGVVDLHNRSQPTVVDLFYIGLNTQYKSVYSLSRLLPYIRHRSTAFQVQARDLKITLSLQLSEGVLVYYYKHALGEHQPLELDTDLTRVISGSNFSSNTSNLFFPQTLVHHVTHYGTVQERGRN